MATLAMEKETAKMESEAEIPRLRSELEALRKNLEARISALEALVPKAAAAEAEDHVSVETLAVIAAAVTSYLGKKVKIRAAHLVPTASTWAQAGRASVQASHNLNR
jgi:CII-binding regulator of phage lambda lysogenization HflD